LTRGGRTVDRHSTHYSKVKGLSLPTAAVTRGGTMAKS